MKKKALLILISVLAISLSSCKTDNDSSTSSITSQPTSCSSCVVSPSGQPSEPITSQPSEPITSQPSVDSVESESSIVNTDPQTCEFCNSKAATITYPGTMPEYTPTTFSSSNFEKTSKSLGEGVDLVEVNYTLNNDRAVKVFVVEVDLTLASIVSGSYNNELSSAATGLQIPLQQAEAYERNNSNKKVIAVTNADFFGNGITVNAFVKESNIIKAAHNNNGSDVPESTPRLFGISGTQAQIGAMTDYEITDDASYTANQTARLYYGIEIYNDDCTSTKYTADMTASDPEKPWIISKENYGNVPAGKTLVTVSTLGHSRKHYTQRGYVTEIEKLTTSRSVTSTNETMYLVLDDEMAKTVRVGTAISAGFIKSADGKWDYYTNILGARHSLVEKGLIPATVARETSNGAKGEVPRTAIGIMADGKVMIVSVEDLSYGTKLLPDVNNGLSLVQLADFMRYYGAYDAANFDGGGSTQLLTKTGLDGAGIYKVITRSSDSSSLSNALLTTSTRRVANTILVTTK